MDEPKFWVLVCALHGGEKECYEVTTPKRLDKKPNMVGMNWVIFELGFISKKNNVNYWSNYKVYEYNILSLSLIHI